MKALVVILVVCLCLVGVAQALPGVLWPGLGDIAVLGAVAAAVLVLRAWWRRDRTGPLPYVVVDGSNVLHWRDNLPDMARSGLWWTP